jgi:muramoyltetrapeptide carboxypeptidase
MRPVRIPSALKAGDVVSIVAPSGPVTLDALNRNVEIIESMGFRVKFRSDLFDKHVDFAGTTERRVTEFLEALGDPDTKAIWAARGGYGAAYLLDELDVDSIRKANKWLIGFSDITVLHAAWEAAGVVSLHATVVRYLERWTLAARLELASYLTGRRDRYVLEGEAVQGDEAVEGWLTGGNVSLLASLAGTPYPPSWCGAIVLFEDINEAPYRLDRQLLQLYQAGAFHNVMGIALGQFTNCVADDPEDSALGRITTFLTTHVPVPIIAGLPVGHEDNSRAVPFGASAILDPIAATLTINSLNEDRSCMDC